MMAPSTAIDRYVAKLAREEQEDINRKQGQQLLDLMTARGDKDPFIELLNRAHRAKVEEDNRP